MLEDLGLKVPPSKGFFLPTQIGEHMGMVLDYERGEFRAPTTKFKSVDSLAKSLLCKAAANKRWVSVKSLASLARKAQFLHLAIPVARFFCENYTVWSPPPSPGWARYASCASSSGIFSGGPQCRPSTTALSSRGRSKTHTFIAVRVASDGERSSTTASRPEVFGHLPISAST